ncbi:MAG: AAA family ATPase, partial [Mariprofundus sp.]|nr:AAA family ATPase [Mariprofundus sp.]
MLIKRTLWNELLQLLSEYRIVTLLGPRQAGKTTLAKQLLSEFPQSIEPDFAYCNLEIPENRELATHDPKAFLCQFKGRVVLDEIQRVPLLLSYIQARVDENKLNGQGNRIKITSVSLCFSANSIASSPNVPVGDPHNT